MTHVSTHHYLVDRTDGYGASIGSIRKIVSGSRVSALNLYKGGGGCVKKRVSAV